LGVGWIGRHRLEALARTGLVEIAALADSSHDALVQATSAAPTCRLVDSLEALLALDLEGLVIATPSALHAEQAIQALDRGLAVFCQKPLARTAAETQRVVEAARRADRLLAVDLSYRQIRGVEQMRELVQSGAVGEVYAVDLCFHNAYGPDKPWFYDPALAGGGCVMDLGTHLIDLLLWILDFPPIRSVSSRLLAGGRELSNPGRQVEDFAMAQIDLESGGVARLACSWRLSAGCDAVIEAAFYGTQGAVALRNMGGSFYDFSVEHFQGTSRRTLAAPPDAWGGRAIVDWGERLARGERFAAETDRLVDVARLLDAVYRR
jgi:predicted dehydrogenase